MKKPYRAPEIFFEDFSLSSSIAAGCEFVANSAENICGYLDIDGTMIFVTGVTGCQFHQPDGYDSACYHVPNDYANVFAS